jgi:hypothetical protein
VKKEDDIIRENDVVVVENFEMANLKVKRTRYLFLGTCREIYFEIRIKS